MPPVRPGSPPLPRRKNSSVKTSRPGCPPLLRRVNDQRYFSFQPGRHLPRRLERPRRGIGKQHAFPHQPVDRPLVYPDVLSSLRSRVPSRSDTYKVSSRPPSEGSRKTAGAPGILPPGAASLVIFPGPSDIPSPPVRPAPALCAPRPGTRACADGCLPSGCTGAARRFSAGHSKKRPHHNG